MIPKCQQLDVQLLVPHDGLNGAAFTAYRGGFRPKPSGILSWLISATAEEEKPNQNLILAKRLPAKLTPCRHGLLVQVDEAQLARVFGWPWAAIQQVVVSNLKFQHYGVSDPARVAICPRKFYGLDPGMVPNIVSTRDLPYSVLVPYGLRHHFDVWENGQDQQSWMGRCLTDTDGTDDVKSVALDIDQFRDNCMPTPTVSGEHCMLAGSETSFETWLAPGKLQPDLYGRLMFAIERNTMSPVVTTSVVGPPDAIADIEQFLEDLPEKGKVLQRALGLSDGALSMAAKTAIKAAGFSVIEPFALPLSYAKSFRKEAARRLVSSFEARSIVCKRTVLSNGQHRISIRRQPS